MILTIASIAMEATKPPLQWISSRRSNAMDFRKASLFISLSFQVENVFCLWDRRSFVSAAASSCWRSWSGSLHAEWTALKDHGYFTSASRRTSNTSCWWTLRLHMVHTYQPHKSSAHPKPNGPSYFIRSRTVDAQSHCYGTFVRKGRNDRN